MARRTSTTRRPWGAGSIYPRKKDGQIVGYIGAYEVRDEQGRRSRRFVSAKTEAECQRRLNEARSTSASRPAPERELVADWMHRWLADVAAPRIRTRTLVGYQQLIDRHVDRRAIGAMRLEKVRPDDIRAWHRELLAEVSPRTAVHAHAVLRAGFAQAVVDRKITISPFEGIKPPRVERRRLDTMRAEEVRSFLTSIEGHPLEALFLLAVTTGMRQGEILGLRWQDVDLDAGHLTVYQSLVLNRITRQYEFQPPKTDESVRRIPLMRKTAEALRAHRLAQVANPLGLVFADKDGAPLYGVWVTRRFQAALEAAGLRRWRFHDLRHTATTLLIEQGAGLEVIKDVLGHSTINTTVDFYGHLTEQHKRAAIERMEGLLA